MTWSEFSTNTRNKTWIVTYNYNNYDYLNSIMAAPEVHMNNS